MSTTVRVTRARDGAGVCESCEVADSFGRRLRGLLGRRGLDPGHGLLIRPSNSVHMFFMRFTIDAVLLDKELSVVKIAADLRPWRVAGARHAKAVLELPAGEAARREIAVGDRLALHV